MFPHESYVEVCWLDGNYRKVIYKSTTDNPREIAVDPVKKYLYWLDYGQVTYNSLSVGGNSPFDASKGQLIDLGCCAPHGQIIDLHCGGPVVEAN